MGWTSSEMHKNIINKKDQSLLLLKASKYQFVHLIAECVGWKKLWDNSHQGNEEPREGDFRKV